MYVIVLVTAKDKKEAEAIVQALLKKKLIACANIIEGVNSFFWWQGKIDNSKEVLLIAKSRKSKLPGILAVVQSSTPG